MSATVGANFLFLFLFCLIESSGQISRLEEPKVVVSCVNNETNDLRSGRVIWIRSGSSSSECHVQGWVVKIGIIEITQGSIDGGRL